MADEQKHLRLETEAIVIGYAMSRLDAAYLASKKISRWKQAFAEAADALHVPAANFKDLRDVFDVVLVFRGLDKRPFCIL